MTQEEKAKRYDEVLEELRGLLEGIHEEKCEIMEEDIIEIFPELKESEDEKIRKAIVSGMTAIKNNQKKKTFADIPIDDCIAWLEKQGDKDELIKELDEYKAKYTQEVLEKHLRAMNKDDERLRKTTIAFLKDFADKGYENAIECIDWLEKQGEQKQGPCDNCKDAMLNCHNFPCIKKRAFKQGKSVFEVIKEEPQVYKTKDGEIITYSETDGYKVEQKPQGKTALEAINEEKVDNQNCVKPVDKVEPKDYSSIDPHFFKPTDKIVEKYNITGIGSKHAQGKLGEMIKNLKSVKERLEQKITCGKEDETSIAVNNPDAYKIGFADGEAHAKEEQWKPSDEQIKHLTYVVYDAKHKNRISTNGYEPYSYLYALLMQLKKLKG